MREATLITRVIYPQIWTAMEFPTPPMMTRIMTVIRTTRTPSPWIRMSIWIPTMMGRVTMPILMMIMITGPILASTVNQARQGSTTTEISLRMMTGSRAGKEATMTYSPWTGASGRIPMMMGSATMRIRMTITTVMGISPMCSPWMLPAGRTTIVTMFQISIIRI